MKDKLPKATYNGLTRRAFVGRVAAVGAGIGLLSRDLKAKTVSLTADTDFPSYASYLQASLIDTAAERANRARNRWVVMHWHPGITRSQIQNHAAGIHAHRPETKVVIYTGLAREVHRTSDVWQPLRALADAGDWWAYNSFTSPTRQRVLGFQDLYWIMNQMSERQGVTWPERSYQWLIDSGTGLYGAGSIADLDGLMFDNTVIIDQDNYDFDEDGDSDDRFQLPFRQAQTGALVRRQQFVVGRRSDWFTVANGCKNLMVNAWRRNTLPDIANDVTRFKSIGLHAGIVERPVGFWNSEGGVFYFNDRDVSSSQFSNLRTYPGGAEVTNPVNGDLLTNVFGGWQLNLRGNPTSPGGNPFLYQLCRLAQDWQLFPDPRDLTWQCQGPGPDRIGVWPGVTQHMRYCCVFPPLMGGWSFCYHDQESPGRMVLFDEYEFPWGTPIDPPGIDSGPHEKNVYVRRFETADYDVCLVWNPVFNDLKTITLPNPRSGHRWFRFAAADHLGQDPATNDGGLQGSMITIAERDARVLISRP